ncbi:AAA family ATPase [Thalassovita taeanensis]|uniref:Aminoglycoside phosphotransferase domain-containing protein n=1 Tax=Thalassovita taeanensis TaxID=657014 RepID=A0A1H9IFV2_9RHOB|nr:bifunctional aminoglycoside phosphotransferase/ATP-binding protein [Thalassovita taeanensis]SEQ73407.1 hypothetical protein SAMN04488092_11216 [Thalassovita taeanensis]
MQDDQTNVIAYLSSPAGHPGNGPVSVVETHGALIFLAGDVALKIKRAVKYDYMDLSTLALRETMVRRELALNKPAAPTIYRDVIAVTREADGTLALDGHGPPVEWVLRMWRFPAEAELAVVADTGRFTDTLAEDLGQSVFAYHNAAPKRPADGTRLIDDILSELDRVFADMHAALGATRVADFNAMALTALCAAAPLLTQRSTKGQVRRCHGDLHLRNLVLIDGKPVPFDALEFDETLGTCDVLYDLAFLIMDLRQRDLPRAANIVLNAYLLAAGGAQDSGLSVMPLFLAVRAAILAMVTVQTDQARGIPGHSDHKARQYLNAALVALSPAEPMLICVGGLSGTGKTVLARELAPLVGAAPGAVHLRSDLERKALQGVTTQTHLSAIHYKKSARHQVYQHMLRRAETLLSAGHSVLLDATFLDPDTRQAAARLATDLELPFHGLWLEAPLNILISRVDARIGDASDADATVVQQQSTAQLGTLDWHRIPADGVPETTLNAAKAILLP